MFRSNISSKFLYFVGKVFDENTRKVSTRVNGWQYLRWMSNVCNWSTTLALVKLDVEITSLLDRHLTNSSMSKDVENH